MISLKNSFSRDIWIFIEHFFDKGLKKLTQNVGFGLCSTPFKGKERSAKKTKEKLLAGKTVSARSLTLRSVSLLGIRLCAVWIFGDCHLMTPNNVCLCGVWLHAVLVCMESDSTHCYWCKFWIFEKISKIFRKIGKWILLV